MFHWATAKESRFPNAFRMFKNWALFQQIMAGIWMKKVNKENIPMDRPFILCANHTSYLDIILMYRVMPKYFVMMGKGEIENWPLFRRFFVTGMNILVHRENRVKAHRALEQAKEKLDKGHNVGIFPEGGIPDVKAPKVVGFKNGAFKMAVEKQVPIVPVTFKTNWRLLEGTRTFTGYAGPGICEVFIHKPIETKGLTQDNVSELRNKTRDIIREPLLEYID